MQCSQNILHGSSDSSSDLPLVLLKVRLTLRGIKDDAQENRNVKMNRLISLKVYHLLIYH